jgi:multicomponent Na+:H+ antiporter subunit B
MNLRNKEKGSSLSESLAIFIVLILAVLALFIGSKIFFANYLPKGELGEIISAGAIPLYNIFIGIEVAAAIITIFLALVIFKEEVKK